MQGSVAGDRVPFGVNGEVDSCAFRLRVIHRLMQLVRRDGADRTHCCIHPVRASTLEALLSSYDEDYSNTVIHAGEQVGGFHAAQDMRGAGAACQISLRGQGRPWPAIQTKSISMQDKSLWADPAAPDRANCDRGRLECDIGAPIQDSRWRTTTRSSTG